MSSFLTVLVLFDGAGGFLLPIAPTGSVCITVVGTLESFVLRPSQPVR